MVSDTYQKFAQRVRDISSARAIEALLDWDQETYMPRRATAQRAEHIALVAGLAHENLTSDELGDLLARLERQPAGDPAAATNLREMRRRFDRAVKLPTDLVKEIARTMAISKDAWVHARKASDYSRFAPHLEKLIDLKRQVADLIGWKSERYDALMDEFEPGAKAAEVDAVFSELKPHQVKLVAQIKAAPRQPDLRVLELDAPRAAQEAFNQRVATTIGFDFSCGRIDTSTHPFCSGTCPLDVRLTTRYDEKYLPMSLFGVLHEAGHGLYEQGLDVTHVGTPMCESVSLGIHESQSRLWENQVGRSRPFWEHFYPQLQAAFPAYAGVTLDQWHFAVNNVRPSFIRVEADEVTYGLHIMLRFELERKLIGGTLAVKDVPAAWNAAMQQYLGITPPRDAEGCLQDIHWSQGIFGYFPTYQLGNLYSAQFFVAARAALPDLEGQIRAGQFGPLREWLRSSIHRHGMRYRAGELVKVVTGHELTADAYLAYLNGKFRSLYGL